MALRLHHKLQEYSRYRIPCTIVPECDLQLDSTFLPIETGLLQRKLRHILETANLEPIASKKAIRQPTDETGPHAIIHRQIPLQRETCKPCAITHKGNKQDVTRVISNLRPILRVHLPIPRQTAPTTPTNLRRILHLQQTLTIKPNLHSA